METDQRTISQLRMIKLQFSSLDIYLEFYRNNSSSRCSHVDETLVLLTARSRMTLNETEKEMMLNKPSLRAQTPTGSQQSVYFNIVM